MKHTFLRGSLRLMAASFVIISLSQCTKNVKDKEVQSSVSKTLREKSLNLTKQYKVNLTALNNSGVTGTAMLSLDRNMLTVKIDAMGLEPGKLHPQHIHGFMENNRNSKCPSWSDDTNGDGLISLEEGLPSYGPVLLSLTPFPTADANGEIHYMKTFTVDANLLPLQNRAIVLHGKTVMGEYWPTLPIACGQVMVWNGN